MSKHNSQVSVKLTELDLEAGGAVIAAAAVAATAEAADAVAKSDAMDKSTGLLKAPAKVHLPLQFVTVISQRNTCHNDL